MELNNFEEISTEKLQYGLLAQDVQNIFPDLVTEDNSGYLTLDYVGLIPIIIESIKEQQKSLVNKDSIIVDYKNQIQSLTWSVERSRGELKIKIINFY